MTQCQERKVRATAGDNDTTKQEGLARQTAPGDTPDYGLLTGPEATFGGFVESPSPLRGREEGRETPRHDTPDIRA